MLDGNTSHCHTSFVLLRKPKLTSTMYLGYSANIHSETVHMDPGGSQENKWWNELGVIDITRKGLGYFIFLYVLAIGCQGHRQKNVISEKRNTKESMSFSFNIFLLFSQEDALHIVQ